MSTLTIRIPESKHDRLRTLAKARGISINRLIDELATVALAEYDSETRFRAMAARGSKRSVRPRCDCGIRIAARTIRTADFIDDTCRRYAPET